MASRDSAKKWLRRAIASGRVVPPADCQSCHRIVKPRPNAYQPDVRNPSNILWLCPECQSNAINVKGNMPAAGYSLKDLVLKLMKEAEQAEMIRNSMIEAGAITEEQAAIDRETWDSRIAAAQDAYRKEMGFDDVASAVEESQEEESVSPFDLL